VRAFSAKSFRQKTVIETRRSDGLTDEQHKALMAEFDRRISGFKEKWRKCRDRNCGRHRQCLGPPFVCKSNGGAPRWTRRLYRRLKRDIARNPPQVPA